MKRPRRPAGAGPSVNHGRSKRAMSGEKGFVLCVCQGTCPSFTKMDILGVLSDVRREKIFDYVCLHPQLCVGDGEEFMKVLMRG